eukprot:COSAG01_NODE_76107_length_190_cov_19.362637_1_plen_44_part_10
MWVILVTMGCVLLRSRQSSSSPACAISSPDGNVGGRPHGYSDAV